MSNDGVTKLSPFTHETCRHSDGHVEGVEAVRHRDDAVDPPFGEGVVTGVAAQGRVAVALTWGGRAALERRLVTSAPPPPPPDSSPSIPTARWTGSSPDVNWFRARADFADY